MRKNLLIWLSTSLLITILLSACGGAATPTMQAEVEEPVATEAPAPTDVPPTAEPEMTEEPMSGMMLPEVDPSTVTGNIISAGSSTVFPLIEAIAQRFQEEGFTEDKGKLTIESIGSGAGLERFCKTGETDIANASRAIKQEEIDNCAAINRTPIEFRVGTDALAVVVSSENDFLSDVTKEELALIFSKDATQWSDVRPEWPSEDILRFSPG